MVLFVAAAVVITAALADSDSGLNNGRGKGTYVTFKFPMVNSLTFLSASCVSSITNVAPVMSIVDTTFRSVTRISPFTSSFASGV